MTPTTAERRSAAWVAGLFLMAVVLQRFAIPGLPMIALLVPAVLVWAVAAFARGVVVVDSTRLIWWLTFASVAGILMLVQSHVVEDSRISVNAWALVLAVWLPFVFRLTERGVAAYTTVLRYITNITTGLGAASIAMIGIQLAGVKYEDWFARIVPPYLQLDGFNTSYPIEFRAPIYKSNAIIGLEPSIVSALLGVGILAAILTSARTWKHVVLILGLIATLAGSGMIILLIGILVMLAHKTRRLVFRYAATLVIVAVVSGFTTFGRLVYERLGESTADNSSTSLRVFVTYRLLFPEWTEHLAGALLGYGPGSSQRTVMDTGIEGLLVPTPAKIFFEYGLLGGLLLGGFVLICYWGGPSRTFGVSLLVSTWLLQPGLTTVIIVVPVLVTVTLWSPRIGAPIESLPSPPPLAHSEDEETRSSRDWPLQDSASIGQRPRLGRVAETRPRIPDV